MGVVRKNLLRIVESVTEIEENEDLKRGILLLKLIYANFLEEAYQLAAKKMVSDAEIQEFEAFYVANVKG